MKYSYFIIKLFVLITNPSVEGGGGKQDLPQKNWQCPSVFKTLKTAEVKSTFLFCKSHILPESNSYS